MADELDGRPLVSPRWSRARLIAPVVLAAGLLLSLAATESAAQSTPTGFSSFFRVSGRVSQPKIYRLADLKALLAHTVNVSFQGPGGVQTHQFTGALLNDVAAAAKPRFDAAVRTISCAGPPACTRPTTTRSSLP